MNYLLLAAMWIVGIVVYSLGVLQCLICLFCGLPMTSMLGREFPGKVDIGGLRGSIYCQCSFGSLFLPE